jgi:nitrate reductase gamma subunit
VHRKLSIKESSMNKMAIFLGGFLALTILIGMLATISPV